MTTVVFSGTFDPLTLGHLDIITRLSQQFDTVYVIVSTNPQKQTLFSLTERCAMVEEATCHLSGVVVAQHHSGMLVGVAKELGAVIVRSMRDASDAAYERTLSQYNREQSDGVETLFIFASPQLQHISSSMVKEVYRVGGDVSAYVPTAVYRALREKEEQEVLSWEIS